ncbi:helix-turn-helix domain-containing protein [Oxalobacteraceae bacterium]|nr:helix-turn-helix domain-containing protein [Oxalobacteraceae bacterium]
MVRKLATPGPTPSSRMQSLSDLGAMVRHRRLELSLRIDDAADACGVAANVFSRLENGGSIGADRLLLILAGLGLTMVVATKDQALSLLAFQSEQNPSGRSA